jgi:hypothetical protein
MGKRSASPIDLPEAKMAKIVTGGVDGKLKRGSGLKWKNDTEGDLQAIKAKKDYDEPSKNPPRPRKSDEELRRDAKDLESQVPKIAQDKITVATVQDGDGRLYYSVSGNNTDSRIRNRARELGYQRLHGGPLKPTGSHHAEQVAANALEANGLKPPIRVAPSKQPCDDNPKNAGKPGNQGCRERLENNPDTSLAGWD